MIDLNLGLPIWNLISLKKEYINIFITLNYIKIIKLNLKGTGIEKYLLHASRECIDLIKLLLTYDPEKRITASNALKHEYFKDIYEGDIF